MRRSELVLLDGARVGAARRQRLLTREELAKAAGCSLRLVWCVHNGRAISLKMAKRIAKALAVPLLELVVPGKGEAAELRQLASEVSQESARC